MFRSLVIGLIAISVFAAGAAAQGLWGLGIILGEPTGVTGKLWLTDRTAVDAAAAWSFAEEAALHLHADYLFHNTDLIEVEKGTLPIYFGVGARVKFEEDGKLGVRVPVGIAYWFEDAPLDVFFEIVPILDLIDETEFTANAAIGIRYFFGSGSARAE
ncbi:MAG: hypothetical protein JSW58_13380 [Candidatus Latescibacterota bacterium]|nr:MAG: hypothetical protein JSW58_13380 [Candidatus Latescibacterota bacterium]